MEKAKHEMKKALRILNELEEDGHIRRYAIGGAIGALFYMSPFETEDLDVLVLLPAEASKRLDPLSPIYEELRRRGFKEDGPYVLVHGVPVRFQIAYNDLAEEAIEQSCKVPYDDVLTRVPSPEYLAAIMLGTGRPKDRARFAELRTQANLDNDRLMDILKRHDLTERFRQWTTN